MRSITSNQSGQGVSILVRAAAVATLLATVFPSAGWSEENIAEVRPSILSRQDWAAKPALPGLVPHKVVGIIIHHTGVKKNTRSSFPAKLRNLQSYSQSAAEFMPGKRKPAWADVPYHFYIDANGVIAEGRDVRYSGDTNTNYDPKGYVQVVVEGDFRTDRPSAKQLSALQKVVLWQSLSQGVPAVKISVHSNHASTECPGKHLADAIPGLLARLSSERSKLRSELCQKKTFAETHAALCSEP